MAGVKPISKRRILSFSLPTVRIRVGVGEINVKRGNLVSFSIKTPDYMHNIWVSNTISIIQLMYIIKRHDNISLTVSHSNVPTSNQICQEFHQRGDFIADSLSRVFSIM